MCEKPHTEGIFIIYLQYGVRYTKCFVYFCDDIQRKKKCIETRHRLFGFLVFLSYNKSLKQRMWMKSSFIHERRKKPFRPYSYIVDCKFLSLFCEAIRKVIPEPFWDRDDKKRWVWYYFSDFLSASHKYFHQNVSYRPIKRFNSLSCICAPIWMIRSINRPK